MSDSSNSTSPSNNSFSHAFLPGLILGLIIGAVAGAFLPDWLGGPKLPAQRGEMGDLSQPLDHGMESDRDSLSEEDQQIIDDAMNEIEDEADVPATDPETDPATGG